MFSTWLLLCIAFAYLGSLFAIAWYADKRANAGRSLIANPYIYTLSLAIYCTAWTFFGSVGHAANTGAGFLPVFLGPSLMLMLWWVLLAKIIRISKNHRITSIADFIGSRYGKSTLLSGLVTIIAIIGILPYIALQLKAIVGSFDVLTYYPILPPDDAPLLLSDKALYIALLLALFTIIFGTRHLDLTERHEGMVAAIAFESIIKLVAFLSVGLFVSFGLFNSPGDLFSQVHAEPALRELMTVEAIPGQYSQWFSITLLSMLAILVLPRQFQVAVVENVNEAHVRKATWLFPLYLFAINFFVLPVALGGRLLLDGSDPDFFVLTLPLSAEANGLALLAFIGGLSAATGMVIVATITLSTMVSNDLIMPLLLRTCQQKLQQKKDFSHTLLRIRRLTIVLILLLGYAYFRLLGESYALVSIGLLSFAAAAQFAPSILIGLYWKGACHRGAIWGLALGFGVWVYTLLLPAFALSGWLPEDFIYQGPFGISALRPYALFGLEGLDEITHSVFWSLLLNIGALVLISLFSQQSTLERLQAVLFTDALRNGVKGSEAYYWGGHASNYQLQALVERFLGRHLAYQAFSHYAQRHQISLRPNDKAEPKFINFCEGLLAGAIGSASAHVLVAAAVQGESLTMEGVMKIISETSQIMEYSQRLEQKSRELEATSQQLRAANERLQELDKLKDEVVATVSHELRTPLTSIRAFSEILLNTPDIDSAQRQEFLHIIVKEAERLTRLINEVLDLAKIESGRMEWYIQPADIRELTQDALNAVSQLLEDRQIHAKLSLPEYAVYAQVDKDRLIQVLINLLSNAGKFCPDQNGEIHLSLQAMGSKICIRVSDNGPGIPEEHLEHVFDKFFQIEDQQAGKPKGSGLGLPICRGIIEHHQGKIWAEAGTEGGACFVVLLPKMHEG